MSAPPLLDKQAFIPSFQSSPCALQAYLGIEEIRRSSGSCSNVVAKERREIHSALHPGTLPKKGKQVLICLSLWNFQDRAALTLYEVMSFILHFCVWVYRKNEFLIYLELLIHLFTTILYRSMIFRYLVINNAITNPKHLICAHIWFHKLRNTERMSFFHADLRSYWRNAIQCSDIRLNCVCMQQYIH